MGLIKNDNIYITENLITKLSIENKNFFQQSQDISVPYIETAKNILEEIIGRKINNIVVNTDKERIIISFLGFKIDETSITWIMVSSNHTFKKIGDKKDKIEEINRKVHSEINIVKLEDQKKEILKLDIVGNYNRDKKLSIKINEKDIQEIISIFNIINESFDKTTSSIVIGTDNGEIEIPCITPINPLTADRTTFTQYIDRLVKASNIFDSLIEFALFEKIIHYTNVKTAGEAALKLNVSAISQILNAFGIKQERIKQLEQKLKKQFSEIKSLSDHIYLIKLLNLMYALDPKNKVIYNFENKIVDALYTNRDILKELRMREYSNYKEILLTRKEILDKLGENITIKREKIWIRAATEQDIKLSFMNNSPETITIKFLQCQDATTIFHTTIKYLESSKLAIEQFLKESFFDSILTTIEDVKDVQLYRKENLALLEDYKRSCVILRDKNKREIAEFWLIFDLLKEIIYGPHKYLINRITFPIYQDPTKRGVLVSYKKEGHWSFKIIGPRKYDFYIIGKISNNITSKGLINKIKRAIIKVIKK